MPQMLTASSDRASLPYAPQRSMSWDVSPIQSATEPWSFSEEAVERLVLICSADERRRLRALCKTAYAVVSRLITEISIPRFWSDEDVPADLLSKMPNLRCLRLGGCITSNQLQRVILQNANLFRVLSSLEFSTARSDTNALLQLLGMCSQLEELTLKRCPVENRKDDNAFVAVASTPRLQRLELTCTLGLSDLAMQALGTLSQLKYLKLLTYPTTGPSDRGLFSLRGLANLEELHLTCPNVTGIGLASCVSLIKLTKLSFHGLAADSKVTAPGVEVMLRLTRLQTLDLELPSAVIVNVDWSVLTKLSYLKSLRLVVCNQAMVQAATQLPGLEQLTLSWPSSTGMARPELEKLSELTTLKELALDGAGDITGPEVAVLGQLPLLHTLTLSNCRLMHQVVPQKEEHCFAALRVLHLADMMSAILGDNLWLIQLVQNVEDMDVNNVAFFGDGALLAVAKGCAHLRQLALAKVPITDVGVIGLVAAARLTKLRLRECSKLSCSAVAAACTWPALRDLHITTMADRLRGEDCRKAVALLAHPSLHVVITGYH